MKKILLIAGTVFALSATAYFVAQQVNAASVTAKACQGSSDCN